MQVLGTLPPSMQLELMTKLREQKTYQNREKFAQHQGQPLSFSQFQMANYLKTSAFKCALLARPQRSLLSAAAGTFSSKR